MAEKFSIKIGGSAGQGIKSAGIMLAKIATRSGFNIYSYTEYPSLIRGGHNVMQILISSEEVLAPSLKTDFLIALNQETIDLHLNELDEKSIILCDGESASTDHFGVVSVPLSKLANDAGGRELLINTVALGATVGLLGGDLEILQNLIGESFSEKAEIMEANKKAALSGFDFIKQNHVDKIKETLKKAETISPKMIINGNDGMALGAIAGGLQFASIYPMTPITNLLHSLALYQENYGYIFKQPEDEISAVNMAIGASIAGARSLTATSGGGFCLMTEGIGLAGITETPLVIILGMRGGPSTGLPTWSEQGDLQFALHAGHGDFPKIVLSAGDSREAFDLTKEALNLADKYQTPVILLVDKNICENDQSFHIFRPEDDQPLVGVFDRGKFSLETIPDYQRYALSDDGISIRSIPGKGNFFIANSDEHDEFGFDDDGKDVRNSQMKKRMSKLQTCQKNDMPTPQIFGPQKSDLTIVSWGSNKGAILESLKSFPNVNFLYLTWLNPFPTDHVRQILAESKYILDIENNFTGQLSELIREKTGIEIMDKMLKYDGRPIFPEEIEDKIKQILKI
ncbi:MAG: 2-oxoacid:acceptor oxidoreductase subunit alpha [Candidatus Daviesbacteria bacterium]|nr:2-oxoacid:acceptor oxidoreductase subunit alpha [Candidatus Daviesbacteria bacterium]